MIDSKESAATFQRSFRGQPHKKMYGVGSARGIGDLL